MWKFFAYNGTYEWVKNLQDIINQYNNKKHRTIKMKPISVNKRNEKQIRRDIYHDNIKIRGKADLSVGQHVRISDVEGMSNGFSHLNH